ncbi:MAG TPA: MBL fold metallo-hydrolase [Solirubrobacterales bacterium]|jgi:glyoxylase-like metal-dependent hydrolase (beta-lactamase superfamily II)|nr:MBL fold metallo-hydrolase [Solirubrobacterales bacterium]
MEKVADGVWLLRGDARRSMNIYFLEDGGGVVQFDAGTKAMAKKARAAADRLGGLKRIVLGHAHADHRGTAPSLDAPVHCHPDEVADAEAEAAIAPYMEISRLPIPARWIYPTLLRRWDGGAVKIDGIVSEGDEVAGFRVVHFPGHAPGQIGLWREGDRLALVSDVVYLIDSTKMGRPLPKGEASVPHPAWGWDHAKAKDSVRKLAALEPTVVCAGHDEPLRGENLREALERAAEKY